MTISKSKIFLYFCLAFIVGIGLAPYFNFSSFVKIILILFVSIFIFAFWRNYRFVVFLFCFIFFILGIWRYDLAKKEITSRDLAYYNNKEILFEGKIVEEPDIRTSQTKLVVEAKKLYLLSKTEINEIKKNLGFSIFYEDLTELPQKEISGKVLLNLPRYPTYYYGDYLLILAYLKTPKNPTNNQNNFSYREYLSRYQIYSVSYYPKIITIRKEKGNFFIFWLLKIKKQFEKIINQLLPEPYSAFLAGLLFGAKKAIPEDLLEKFNLVGLSHILVVSGYNITIIAIAVNALFSRFFSRKNSFWFSFLAIFIFVILVGGQSPVVRAAIMGILVLLAKRSGRFSNITNSLAFTACLMLLVNPKILSFDLGFQLSFLATIGIVYLSPHLEKFVKWLPEIFEIRETTKITLSAQILVIPKILLGFSKISLISLFANILILPIIPITMFFGFITGILGQISLSLAKISAYFSYSLLNYEISVVEFFDKFLNSHPAAIIQFEKIENWWIWVYFFIVAIIYILLKQKNQIKQV